MNKRNLEQIVVNADSVLSQIALGKKGKFSAIAVSQMKERALSLLSEMDRNEKMNRKIEEDLQRKEVAKLESQIKAALESLTPIATKIGADVSQQLSKKLASEMEQVTDLFSKYQSNLESQLQKTNVSDVAGKIEEITTDFSKSISLFEKKLSKLVGIIDVSSLNNTSELVVLNKTLSAQTAALEKAIKDKKDQVDLSALTAEIRSTQIQQIRVLSDEFKGLKKAISSINTSVDTQSIVRAVENVKFPEIVVPSSISVDNFPPFPVPQPVTKVAIRGGGTTDIEATVVELNNSNALVTQIVDGDGDTITTFPVEPDGTALSNGQVSVDTTVNGTTILAASAGRQGVTITNQGSVACYIGTGNVSAANGFLLNPGESLAMPTDSEVKGFTSTGSTTIGYLAYS